MSTPTLDIAAGAIPFEVVTLTALAAGEIREVRGRLGYVSLLTATNVNKVSISFNGGSFFALTDGIVISDFDAPTFWCRNDEAVATNTLVFAKGNAQYRDNRLILSALAALPVATTIAAGGVASGAFAAGSLSAGALAAGSIAAGAAVAGSFVTGAIVDLGLKADAAATTDAGTFSLIALIKRLLGKLFDKVSSVYTVNAANTTNSAVIKASAGAVLSVSAFNASGATRYVKFYDKATAPTVGTDVPYRVVAIPATSSKEIAFPYGDTYALGIGVGIVTGAAVTDATAPTAGDVQLTVNYQ